MNSVEIYLVVAIVFVSMQFTAATLGAAPFDDLNVAPSLEDEKPRPEDDKPATPNVSAGKTFLDEVAPQATSNPPAAGQGIGQWSSEQRMLTPKIQAARAALKAGDVRKCLAHLNAAMQEDPSLPPDLLMLAQLYALENRFGEGTLALENAASHYKDHPEVYQVLGALALAQGRNSDAWVHYEKALLLKPPSSWSEIQTAHFKASCIAALADVCQRRGDWAGAAAMYENWAKITPADAALLTRWAHALLQLGKPDAAFEKLAQVHEADAAADRPELAMASLCMKMGNFSLASEWYEKGAEKYPDDGRVHFEHAAAALIVGQTELARQQLDKAMDVGTNLDDLGVNLPLLQGWIARSEKRYETAEGFFREALRLSPGNSTALYHLPLVLIEQADESKRQQALQIADIYAQKRPNSPYALTALGWVQFRLDKPDQAETSLVKAAPAAASNGETAYYLAQVLLANGKANEAAKYVGPLRKAVDAPQIFIPREEARQWLQSVALAFE